MRFTHDTSLFGGSPPELIDPFVCHGFVAPVIAAVAGAASTIAPIVSVASGLAGIASSVSQMKAAKKASKQTQAPPPVVPLPSEAGGASRLAIARNRAQRSGRRGFGSTLVGGQLGDTSAPQTSAPLVLGG